MPPLTEGEGRLLLHLAREALEEILLAKSPAPAQELPEALLRPAAVFVTLTANSRLRGCIGRIDRRIPLYRAVRECAVSAATEDFRFDPVRPDEVAKLEIEISVLSEFQPVLPEQIEVGRDGLIISQGDRSGILLPKVAAERDWDSVRFLEETCAKAGLDRQAWRRGARIQAFTAQVFAESKVKAAGELDADS